MLFLLLIVDAIFLSNGNHVNGSINSDGVCVCSVVFPNISFPVEKVEYLETAYQEISINVQREISKVQEYTRTLAVNTAKLQNLTRRVESLESGGFYTQLEFDLLKLEIRELMSLTGQLAAFLNGSNSMIDQLYNEILNMSQAVDQLESLDKHNLLAIRREIATLKKRLQDCEEHRESQTPTSVDYGSCDHNGLLNVSNPMVIQLNWRGFSYKSGGWGRGSAPNSSEGEVYWVAPLNTDWRTFDSFRFYYSHDDLLLYRNATTKTLSYSYYYSSYYTYRGQGSGMVLYEGFLYYNCYNSRYMCRFNIDTDSKERQFLTGAAYNNRFSYAGVTYQDMDFAVDEFGLWVIYSLEANVGYAAISKINVTSFTVERTWVTRLFKPSVTNAFVICGVLYAIRPVDLRSEEIFYTFDTRTGEEGAVSIKMGKVMDKLQNVNYNPSDHKLYVYNNGYQITYDVIFKPE
ncbi:olfactomedin-4-like [Scyliorhinus canicula]|uniref:olfactomedin-4-like n=1 Tax=Scyliorhinus canicula TaxID=7830 RepID=UPI0018F784BE|nr:olfactomedin-4-like [Scyliorhinus canicula]